MSTSGKNASLSPQGDGVNAPSTHDFAWLVSEEAAPWLDQASDTTLALHTRIGRLRTAVGVERAALLTTQAELRVRALRKFSAASQMFFTQRSLEQATDEHSAAYKSGRFHQERRIADFCCGIGGDLLSLARQGSVCGVDHDEIVALFAVANAQAAGVTVKIERADVATIPVAEFDAWHLDPDRRTEKGRSVDLRWHNPSLDVIEKMLAGNPNAAIKLAPAADIPSLWREASEREWISRQGECKQQVIWRGSLTEQPGARTATMISTTGISATGTATSFTSPYVDETPPPITAQLKRFMIEPDAAVIAARLVGAVAEHLALEAISPRIAYLTSDSAVNHASVRCFEIVDVLPFDVKQLKAYLKTRRIGRLEIKKRGVPEDIPGLRKRLKLKGEHAAVLFLSPVQGRTTAIIAQRVSVNLQT